MSAATTTSVATQTVLERLTQSGITEARALAHITNGWVSVEGRVVTDPAQAVEPHAHLDIRISWPSRG